MLELRMRLKSSGSNGEHELILSSCEKGEFGFTLVGEYRDAPIQIDFNVLTTDEIFQFRDDLQVLIERYQ